MFIKLKAFALAVSLLVPGNIVKINETPVVDTPKIETVKRTENLLLTSAMIDKAPDIDNMFTSSTAAIVKNHRNDFNVYNFQQKMKEYGGYENYLKSLGGVFAKWAGKTANVKSAKELQEIAEYEWGIMTMWGFDYCNYQSSHYGKWLADDGVGSDAYYPKGTDSGRKENSSYMGIDTVASGNGRGMTVNCNLGVDWLLRKAGLFTANDPDSYDFSALMNKGAKIITKASDLQPGDLIQCFTSGINRGGSVSSWWGGGYFHITIVGERDEKAGTITLYDSGHLFTDSGKWKNVRKIGDDNVYQWAADWVGMRIFDLIQNSGAGWQDLGDGKWNFMKDDGTLAMNEWLQVDDEWFHFDEEGLLQTGITEINGKKYFLNDDISRGTLGKQLSGWVKAEDNKTYYLSDSGVVQTGWKFLNGIWYYMNSTGVMQTGWQKIKGKWYYMNSSGSMAKGWRKVDDKWYYLNSDGQMQTGWLLKNDRWYYLNSSGAMATGWKKHNNKWYYLNDSGSMVTGWKQVNGIWYYMAESGKMLSGWQVIKDKWYYFNESGGMATGWKKYNNKWYYMNESGSMATGWKLISGTWYYFEEDGQMARNKWIDERYYVNNSGALTDETPDNSLGKAEVIVDDLRIRTGAGLDFDQVSMTYSGTVYDVYEIEENNGYTWYRIGENRWIADDGYFVRYTSN